MIGRYLVQGAGEGYERGEQIECSGWKKIEEIQKMSCYNMENCYNSR